MSKFSQEKWGAILDAIEWFRDYCRTNDAETISKLPALVASLAAMEGENAKLKRLLGLMYDKYENGDDCYEEPEEFRGFLGKAFRLAESDENEIIAALSGETHGK